MGRVSRETVYTGSPTGSRESMATMGTPRNFIICNFHVPEKTNTESTLYIIV